MVLGNPKEVMTQRLRPTDLESKFSVIFPPSRVMKMLNLYRGDFSSLIFWADNLYLPAPYPPQTAMPFHTVCLPALRPLLTHLSVSLFFTWD